MGWLENFLSQETLILLLSIMIMLGFFMFAAYRSHLTHKKRIKEIDKTFNLTDKFTR